MAARLDGKRETPSPCKFGECHFRVSGYHFGPRGDVDCERPLRWTCDYCRATTIRPCRGKRESVCRPCAGRYRRNVRSMAWSGMVRERSSTGFLYLLTLTAPGERQHSLPGGEVCPCTPEGGVDLAEWNASHSGRWNHLRTNLRRDHDGLHFMRGVEVQKRGALHDHALVWSPTPLNLAAVRRRAIAAGFGHSVDLAECEPGSRKAAYYVSKYVTKACDARALVPWAADVVDLDTGEVTREVVAGRYRTWSCSRGWGTTMAEIKAAGRAYAQLKAEERRAEQLSAALVAVVGGLGRVELLLPDRSG